MLAKILLTITVILLAFLVLRHRHQAEAGTKASNQAAIERRKEKENLNKDLRIGAYLFLILMVGLGAGLYYSRWQDDHQVLTVTLHGADGESPVIYEVYKYQLGERSFTTVGGTRVTVASSERMEIEGLSE